MNQDVNRIHLSGSHFYPISVCSNFSALTHSGDVIFLQRSGIISADLTEVTAGGGLAADGEKEAQIRFGTVLFIQLQLLAVIHPRACRTRQYNCTTHALSFQNSARSSDQQTVCKV